MIPTIDAIIFDRDGTLIVIDDRLVEAIEAELRVAIPLLPAEAAITHWLTWPGPWPRTAANEPVFWTQFWETLARQHSLTTTDIAQMHQFSGRYQTAFRAYPDTLPCLRMLLAQHPQIKLAVLTNFELPSVDVTLQHAGIPPDWFDLLLSSSMLGVAKPNLAAFQAVCDQLLVHPRACVCIDDLPSHVAGAVALGMRGILIDRDDQYPMWHGERIRSLDELLPILMSNIPT